MLAFSIASKRIIDLAAALTYPLSPIPLSLATDDGYRMQTLKIKLTYVLTEGVTLKDSKADNPVKSIKENTTFEIDLINLITICTMLNVPNICEECVRNFARSFKQLDIVADTYRENRYLVKTRT